MNILSMLLLSGLLLMCDTNHSAIQSSLDITKTNHMLIQQVKMNQEFDISFDNLDMVEVETGDLNQYFGFIGVAEVCNYYEYGYKNRQDEYTCVKVTPVQGDPWYIYVYNKSNVIDDENDLEVNTTKVSKTSLDKIIESKSGTLVYVIGYMDEELYAYNQGNMASGCLIILDNTIK